jgi:hypothetical protein
MVDSSIFESIGDESVIIPEFIGIDEASSFHLFDGQFKESLILNMLSRRTPHSRLQVSHWYLALLARFILVPRQYGHSWKDLRIPCSLRSFSVLSSSEDIASVLPGSSIWPLFNRASIKESPIYIIYVHLKFL